MRAGIGQGFDIGGTPLQNAEIFFTWASPYSMVPPPATACNSTDALLSNQTQQCPQGTLRSGVACASQRCGRPADWPADEPFLLPFDFHNATVRCHARRRCEQCVQLVGLLRLLCQCQLQNAIDNAG